MLPIAFSRMIRISTAITIASITTSCMAHHTQSPHARMGRSPSAPTAMDHSQHGSMGHTMDLGPADADFDRRFIDAMIPHHEGAVIMAKAVLKESQRPELKKLAEAMIAAQDQEIVQMQQWRKSWYPKADSAPVMWHRSMQHMTPMDDVTIKSMRMEVDLGMANADFDRRFIDAMIPHHEGALAMAKDLQNKTQRPELKKLAQEILSSQQAEIDQMKQWRKVWYGS